MDRTKTGLKKGQKIKIVFTNMRLPDGFIESCAPMPIPVPRKGDCLLGYLARNREGSYRAAIDGSASRMPDSPSIRTIERAKK